MGYPCKIWKGAIDKDGYAIQKKNGKTAHATRFIMNAPSHLVVDHLCKNTSCVEPSHLELITQKENVWRSNLSKLTIDKAIEIRKIYSKGNITQKALGLKYNVGQDVISRIINNKAWSL